MNVLSKWRRDFFNEMSCNVDVAGKKVLEIGCGDGNLAREVSFYLKPAFIYGIDLDLKAYRSDNLMLLSMNAETLLFPDNYFDCIYSQNTLEHIINIKSAFAEIKRVLKKDGVFISSFAPLWTHAFGHHYYEESEDHFYCAIPPYAHLYWDADQLKELIRKSTGRFSKERYRASTYILGNSCNKLFPHDYRQLLLSNDDFVVEEFKEIREHHHNRTVPVDLYDKYPNVSRSDFEISGILIKGYKKFETVMTREPLSDILYYYNKKYVNRFSLSRQGKKLFDKICKLYQIMRG